jgi:hypothetical protein
LALRRTEPGLQAGWRNTGRSAGNRRAPHQFAPPPAWAVGYTCVPERWTNMGLNIKNEETRRHVRELAARTGETMTAAGQPFESVFRASKAYPAYTCAGVTQGTRRETAGRPQSERLRYY